LGVVCFFFFFFFFFESDQSWAISFVVIRKFLPPKSPRNDTDEGEKELRDKNDQESKKARPIEQPEKNASFINLQNIIFVQD